MVVTDISGAIRASSSPVSSALEVRRPRPDMKAVIGDPKQLLQSLANFSSIPALNPIQEVLLIYIQILETLSSNAEDLKQLYDVIGQVRDSVLQPLQEWTGEVPSELENLIRDFLVPLKKQVEDIKSVQRQPALKRAIQANYGTQKISAMKSILNDAINRFQLRMSTLILLRTEHLSVQTELARLQRAPAEHIHVKTKSKCFESTQTNIQASLFNHLMQAENRFVWLRGSPGTGKTAISLSIASTLKSKGALAASFFWDKNQQRTGLDSIRPFPSTLARQLADFNEDFKMSLIKCLRQSSLALPEDLPPETQMEALIVGPMNDVKDILCSSEGRFVIILDGLDECGDQMTLRELMKLVLMLNSLPPCFAILVSCRPEQQVISTWSAAEARGCHIPCEDMDHIESDEKSSTIRLMVDQGFKDVIERSRWKLSSNDLDIFALGCRELPTMASFRIHGVCTRTERGSSLKLALEYFRDLKTVPNEVNGEYLRILRRAYGTDSSDIYLQVIKNYRDIVGTIAAAREPLSVPDISQLLQIDEDQVYETLGPISSIVDLPSDNRSPVRFFHATAKEFIMGEPAGNESDKMFFIGDTKGYFQDPGLLR